ncbi:PD-(D/E)XK nuclease superfamily [Bacteroidales bacterium 6E]|nr:PD-(D/E)XK nuclease superfamily [Bacteroidales bacterium 6E]
MGKPKNHQEALYDFVINNSDLELLESHLNQFNPFSILRIENFEIRHSNVLAWLLNPDGNHKLDDYFLKKVLSQIIKNNYDNLSDDIDLTNIHFADFGDSIVKREEDNIDILLISENNQLILLIENKFGSKESKHQLTKYLAHVRDNYQGYKILPVLLTMHGDEPEYNNEYAIFSHNDIYRILDETLRLKGEGLNSEVNNFIKSYLKTLEKYLGMDEDLKKLCMKIYDHHKEAIDIINKMVQENRTSLEPAFDMFIEDHDDITCMYKNHSDLWFLPNDILSLLPKVNMGWRVAYPISFWFAKTWNDKIKFSIEVGMFSVKEERVLFMRYLEDKHSYKLKQMSVRPESRYTRLYTKTENVKDILDPTEVLDAIQKLYENAKPEIQKIRSAINGYSWNLAIE